MSAVKAPVPETILKKRQRNAKIRAAQAAKALATKKANKSKRSDIFKRAEKYAIEYRKQQASLVQLRRSARKAGTFYREPEAKVALVVRIRGINGMHPKVRKILRLLRLRQLHNATFVRLNSATKKLLLLVDPYIAYGYPSLKTIRELVYKRGFAKLGGNRVPITDNAVIENVLGKHGIICMEDIIHEIHTCGPKFKVVNKFLWPFKLSSPRGGLKDKGTHFAEGGDSGNREDYINEFVQRMN